MKVKQPRQQCKHYATAKEQQQCNHYGTSKRTTTDNKLPMATKISNQSDVYYPSDVMPLLIFFAEIDYILNVKHKTCFGIISLSYI